MRARAVVMCALLLISSFAVGAPTYKTLLSFDGFQYGDSPYAGLVIDRTGNLYGAAAWGQVLQGSIFQLTPSQGAWKATILYEFDPYQFEGAGPIGGWRWTRLAMSTERLARAMAQMGIAAQCSSYRH